MSNKIEEKIRQLKEKLFKLNSQVEILEELLEETIVENNQR